MTVQNPHDRFFRESFGRPDIVRNYLEEYLPATVRALLKLDTLTQQDGSFIDEAMQEHQTDLLYQVQLHSGATATLYFLFEHKSYPDPLVGLQLLRYMVRFWTAAMKRPDHPPVYLPRRKSVAHRYRVPGTDGCAGGVTAVSARFPLPSQRLLLLVRSSGCA